VNDIHIEQIRHELTWRLRQEVLYPNKQLLDMAMDEDADGIHFGAFKNDDLVGVVSLFKSGDSFQFRKFAVKQPVQKMGIGSSLLEYITDFAIAEGGNKLWCNARLAAIPFYISRGFDQTGKGFSKNGIGYEILEKSISVNKKPA
jgi:GNAT superfamily N-acetyltransferase